MAVAVARRLPGIGFEVQSLQPTEILPRMDVAVFSGFASAGPLHLPVVVEDAAEFAEIFGPDAPLAWDSERGELLHSYLGPAVRAFFRNGGRRCWVIRAANQEEAEYNFFPIPALITASTDEEGKVVSLRQAFARARSEGSWSDPVEVGATLLRNTVNLVRFVLKLPASSDPELPGVEVTVRPLSPGEISTGDLLRLRFRGSNYLVMTPIRDVETAGRPTGSPPAQSGLEERPSLTLTCGPAFWFRTTPPEAESPPNAEATVSIFYPHATVSSKVLAIDWPKPDDDTIAFYIGTTLDKAPPPGAVVRVDVGSSTMWLTVEETGTAHLQGSPPGEAVRIAGHGLWAAGAVPEVLRNETPVCEILTMELHVRRPDKPFLRLSGLGFDGRHEMYWGSLPTDEKMYEHLRDGLPRPGTAIMDAASNPRFPLAGRGGGSEITLPVAMPFVPDYFLGAGNSGRTSLERDGLSVFDSSLFLDPDVKSVSAADLITEADFIRYQSPAPRSLTGIHASLSVEEATILAVPDSVHRGWYRSVPEPAPGPPSFKPIPRPEWWHFLGCAPPPEIPSVKEPRRENFLDCSIRVMTPPVLSAQSLSEPTSASDSLSVESGSYILSWLSPEEGVDRYIVEESSDAEFSNPSTIYSGVEARLALYGKSAGRYFYRARVESGIQTSDWSNGAVVQVGRIPEWTLRQPTVYEPDALLEIQRSAIRMCAARGDMIAVLALPSHFREEDSIKHVSALRSSEITGSNPASVNPLRTGERWAFSFAAVYHPWPVLAPDDRAGRIAAAPPDGIVCGSFAKRASSVGAWIAPANERLNGVLALSPAIGPPWYRRFQDEQINLLRQEPEGFFPLNSDTLSEDEELRPINVRRLLSLLRRLALRLGATYVFEPNDAAFRRRIRRGFESMLAFMHARGAFKGSDPESAYQVVTDSTVNPAESVEQGRFVVELRVAPSLPMRFLTVRLVQAGDRTMVAIEG